MSHRRDIFTPAVLNLKYSRHTSVVVFLGFAICFHASLLRLILSSHSLAQIYTDGVVTTTKTSSFVVVNATHASVVKLYDG